MDYTPNAARDFVLNVQTAVGTALSVTGATGQNCYITAIQGFTDTDAGSVLVTNQTTANVLFEHRCVSTTGGGMKINYNFCPPLRTTGTAQSLTTLLASGDSAALTVTGFVL